MPEFLAIAGAIALGFSVSMPVGPVGVLCVRRSVTHGPVWGFGAGLGAAVADTLYATLALSGLTAITDLLLRHVQSVKLLLAAILIAWGAFILLRKSLPTCQKSGRGWFAAAGTGFLITLANPLAIVAFGAGFALVLPPDHGVAPAALGVFLGASLWWATLSFSAKPLMAGRLRLKTLDRIFGTIMIGFGSVAGIDAMFRILV